MAPSAIALSEEYAVQQLPRFDDKPSEEKCDHDNGTRNAKRLVGEAFKARIDAIDQDNCEVGDEDAFFVADMGDVYRQHLRWKLNLPRVKPHYGTLLTLSIPYQFLIQLLAVKCNPDTQVLRLLAELGTGFDCASKAEIEEVLTLGIDPSRIIYAQPCKTKSHLRYAAQQHVKQMTFDNADELFKIKQLFPDAELFLRILTDDSASLCRLSLKFGAALDSTEDLLILAKKLDLNVVGVAFHVGSGASDPQAFTKAVRDARSVFDQATSIGYEMHTLDVGGGFCGESFEQMASVLSAALDFYFPPSVRIIAEPGRYYVSSAFTLACHVIARRAIADIGLDSNSYMLYLNDGVYGNFSSIMFDHQNPVPLILRCGDKFMHCSSESMNPVSAARITNYSIWGPTCDGIDCICASCKFAAVVDVGDWLYFEDMGAYTRCSATKFNGFTDKHDIIYISSEPAARAILNL